MSNDKPGGPRTIALVGPYLSGKTTLLESILFKCGVITRKGSVPQGNTVGDSSAEARAHTMSVEINAASAEYLGDQFTFLDCPGSVEFAQESHNALVGADAAVVVCEPDPNRVQALAPTLKHLENEGVPAFIFVNKIDKASGRIPDLMQALQSVSDRPLVLRQIPIRDGDEVTGFVDLASERAHTYRTDKDSEVVELPDAMSDAKDEARYEMLEKLADFDDALMEDLLEDKEPSQDTVFGDLAADLQQGLIVPVLLGAAESGHGVRRLLKALRHEAPAAGAALERRGIEAKGEPLAQVLKTFITPHGGKLSLARVWRGPIKDGATLNGERVSGVFRMVGANTDKIGEAATGEVVAFGRLESVSTGDTLSSEKDTDGLPGADRLPAVYGLALAAANRNDEVKLSGAMQKLLDEDPSLEFEQNQDTQQMVLWGQGDIHLRVAFERMHNKYGLEVTTSKPRVPYKEAIKKSTSVHGRFKRQTGGHGQFGDVHLDIEPLPRGTGFEFESKIVGGAVPRQYIPAVENGVKEYLVQGPLGFPVVDVKVTLTDGQYHSVDSSEQAFKTAGRIAMTDGMPKCGPVLLEPILAVDIYVPSDATAKVNGLISGRRGQILGFDARTGWTGWDAVTAHMPQSEVHDLIIELRSLTQGAGTYVWRYDHLQELTGRLADQVVEEHAAA